MNFDNKDLYNPNNPCNEVSYNVKLFVLCEKVVSVKTRPDATEDDIETIAKEALSSTVLGNYVVNIEEVEII